MTSIARDILGRVETIDWEPVEESRSPELKAVFGYRGPDLKVEKQ